MPATHFPTTVVVRLLPRRRSAGELPERLWVMDGGAGDVLGELAREVGEQSLTPFQAAEVTDGDRRRTLIRPRPGAKRVPTFGARGVGYCQLPGAPGVYIPSGHELRPTPRIPVLTRLLGAGAGDIVWVTPAGGGGFVVHRAAASAFRPMAEWVGYTAPGRTRLLIGPPRPPFSFAPVHPGDDHRSPAELPAPVVRTQPPVPDPPAGSGSVGWVRRLAARFRKEREPDTTSSDRSAPEPPPRPKAGDRRSQRVRRKALEHRVLTSAPRLTPTERARLWAELAGVYDAAAEPVEAAVCWLNAVWDHPTPPTEWFRQWVRSEEQVAAESGRLARVAAAKLVTAVDGRTDGMAKLLDAHEGEVPVRAVWLARSAGVRDPLGLTRCRDRLFRRLADGGPGLGVDTPAFLRFVGTTGERGPAVRDWLVQVREPVHRWLERLAPVGSLQWAGLDPEQTATAALADLMLAWGLARAADRDRARDWAMAAAQVLDRPVVPVHRLLADAYSARVQNAIDGRTDSPGLPELAAAHISELDDLGRFAVERLRAVSGILEPVELARPFRGDDLTGLLGDDELGERLRQLVAGTHPSTVENVISAVSRDPTATTLPRSVLVLLERADRLGAVVAAGVVAWVGRAVDLLPEWVRIGQLDDDPAAVVKRFGPRMWRSAAHAARLFHLTEVWKGVLDELRAADQTAPSVVVATRAAGDLFRTCRRLGLTATAREVLGVLPTPTAGGVRDLGLAVGRFAVGDADGATRSLDAARTRLFARSGLDVRKRTELALAYVDALAHAPVGFALGRLAELFHRLGPVHVQGATNRYFTLQPLALIDAAVRAVVGDEFGVGPAVRGWLDDDEYLIRQRITRDLNAVLHADGTGP